MASTCYPELKYTGGPEIPAPQGEEVSHFENFIAAVRSRRRDDRNREILEGHTSPALCHLANISCPAGRKQVFDPVTETFPGDEEANGYLTREYHKLYVLPDPV